MEKNETVQTFASSMINQDRDFCHQEEHINFQEVAGPGPSSQRSPIVNVQNHSDQDVLHIADTDQQSLEDEELSVSTPVPLEKRLNILWPVKPLGSLKTVNKLAVPALAPLSQGPSLPDSSMQPSVSTCQKLPEVPPLVPIKKGKQKLHTSFENEIGVPPLVPIKKGKQKLHTSLENEIGATYRKSKTLKRKFSSDEDYCPSSTEEDDSDEYEPVKKRSVSTKMVSDEPLNRLVDDSDLQSYNARIKLYFDNQGTDDDNNEGDERSYYVVMNDFKMPVNTWNKLYPYQQEGFRWLYTLHKKETGGILGDEMGLGKTVQVITFLLGIEYNRLKSPGGWIGLGPSIIVCPATVIHQWVRHFHEWAPEFRVGVLHVSSSYKGKVSNLVKEIYEFRGILIVTYQGLLKHQNLISNYKWHYVILDEGHKVRTPTAKITVAAKRLVTKHRILLTGSPMQNSLIELWSLFDFTNPGLLGNLQTFEEHFSKPIIISGYENASAFQKQTGLMLASSLKNLISPFLLRRTKREVQNDICLPAKSEQVLFCALSDEQKKLYKDYLLSERVGSILEKGKNWFADTTTRSNVLVAITNLRKLCNHPDIYLRDTKDDADDRNEPPDFDVRFDYKRSGKMTVVSALLKIWKRQGNKVLLFTQGRATLNVLQHFLDKNNYHHLKMDGSTPVATRQSLIDLFNRDTKYFVFLLTTRVGGLGVNLIGANRVIIFDPDWNPATDSQARERAWRIGQMRDVTIYRLLSVGTIEEKIYQRQVWKQLLGNKILVDPRVDKQFFKSSSLFDLFSLNETATNPETANIFHDARVRIPEVVKSEKPLEVSFSEEKINQMKALAHQIALSFPDKKLTAYQQELADERAKKIEEKEKLKALSAPELIQLNREKASMKEDASLNRVDDAVTPASFTEALEYTAATSKLHTELVQGKKKPEDAAKKANELKLIMKSEKDDSKNKPTKASKKDNESSKKKEKKKQLVKKSYDEDGYKTFTDTSGAVDDVKIDGLVKKDIKVRKHRQLKPVESQDDYVLRSLLEKANVSGVLHHETVVQGTSRGTLRLEIQAEERAQKSMEALRRSRLDNFKWEN